MARNRIQCGCGAKMKPVEQSALAADLQAILAKWQQKLPAAKVRTHLCPKCNRAHVHVQV